LKILIVEDEPKVADALDRGLSAEGYAVSIAGSGEDGLRLLDEQPFDFVVLDLGLPGQDGIEVLRTIRRGGLDIHVLILSARDHPDARVLGLNAGADDYLVKPFEFAELAARIRAIARRKDTQPLARLAVGDLEMDLVARTVARSGVKIELTNREFQILECLIRNWPQPVSRRVLARDVWKGMERATPIDNVIDVHIARLRRKLDEGHDTPLIRTIRGVGFSVEAPSS